MENIIVNMSEYFLLSFQNTKNVNGDWCLVNNDVLRMWKRSFTASNTMRISYIRDDYVLHIVKMFQ